MPINSMARQKVMGIMGCSSKSLDEQQRAGNGQFGSGGGSSGGKKVGAGQRLGEKLKSNAKAQANTSPKSKQSNAGGFETGTKEGRQSLHEAAQKKIAQLKASNEKAFGKDMGSSIKSLDEQQRAENGQFGSGGGGGGSSKHSATAGKLSGQITSRMKSSGEMLSSDHEAAIHAYATAIAESHSPSEAKAKAQEVMEKKGWGNKSAGIAQKINEAF